MTNVQLHKAYDRCDAKNRQGLPCKRPAGWGTNHAGIGKCKLHGGSSPIKHGLYSKQLAHSTDIQQRIEQLKNDPELVNIASHLAAVVACLEKVIEQLTSDHKDYEKTVDTLSLVVDRIAKIKEREHKIQVGYYYSPEQVKEWADLLGGVIKKTCSDCPRLLGMAKAIKALRVPE